MTHLVCFGASDTKHQCWTYDWPVAIIRINPKGALRSGF